MTMKARQRLLCLQRSATTDAVDVEATPENSNKEGENGKKIMRKSFSMDTGQAEIIRKKLSESVRRKRISKRRPEPEYGRDTEMYEKVRKRILQERAVTNAIDALQERWEKVVNTYDDCVKMNNKRKEIKLKILSVKRQFDLIVIVFIFSMICLLISGIFVSMNR